MEGRPGGVHGDTSSRQRMIGRRRRSAKPCVNRPITNRAAITGDGVHRSGVEPPITLDSTLHGAGGEPLLKREVARLVEVRGEIIPRGEADQVTHQAEKGLEKTLEVSGVLTPKVGLSQEAVTELGKVWIPRAVNAHDSLQDVAEGAEVTIGGENGVKFPQPKIGHDNGDERPNGDGTHEI